MNPLDFAIEVATEAGKILLSHRGTDLNRTIKRHAEDYATDADYASEKYILSRITEAFPNDAIVAEESGHHEKASPEYTWIVDPLDGTKNFANGSEDFGVFIARCIKDEVVLAVAYNPVQDLLATGELGKGAFLNGTKVDLQTIENVDDKILTANSDLYTRLLPVRESRTKSSAISSTLDVLRGLHSGYVGNAGLIWDFAVPALLAKEAGWHVTNFANRPFIWDGKVEYGLPGIIAAPKEFHAKIVNLLSSTKS